MFLTKNSKKCDKLKKYLHPCLLWRGKYFSFSNINLMTCTELDLHLKSSEKKKKKHFYSVSLQLQAICVWGWGGVGGWTVMQIFTKWQIMKRVCCTDFVLLSVKYLPFISVHKTHTKQKTENKNGRGETTKRGLRSSVFVWNQIINVH